MLWAMDRQTFRRIVLRNAFQKRKMYEALLEGVPLLNTLSVSRSCIILYFLYLPLSTINLKLRSFYQKNHLVLSSEDHTFSGVAFEASSCTNPYGLSTSLGIVLGGYSIGKTNKVLSVCRCSYCCLYLFIKMGNPQPLLSFIFVFSN